MNKLWISALLFICALSNQDFFPRRITYCEEGWYPDPIVTSVANGAATSVTYTFYFALEEAEATVSSVNVLFPSDYSYNGYLSLSIWQLEDTDNCYYASYTASSNLAALTASGPFSLWTNSYSQPTHLGWNFASVGFGPAIATMSSVTARFQTDLDTTGAAEDSTTKENLILQTSTVEVQMTLSKPVYQGDLFVITFSDKFDISKITSVKSVILGKGTSYENLAWTTNKITSDEMLSTNTYNMKFTVSGSSITIYSFNNNIDPRSGSSNDKYAVFQIEGVVNPNAKYAKSGLVFTASTYRYSYSYGPWLIYETKSVSFSDDLKSGSVTSAKCDFSNSAKYSSYITSKKVPVNTLVFVDFTFTLDHPVIGGGKITIQFDGMEAASGTGSTTWIYVSKGLTPTGDYVAASWDATDTISLSGYESSSSAPTITFTTQVKVVSGDCFKSVTSYAADSATKIDEKTAITVSSAVTSDSSKTLFGSTSFAWSFYEGGRAGTSTSFKITSTTGFGSLIDAPTTDSTKTDVTVVVLNVDTAMYTFGSSLFVTDGDHLNQAPSEYKNATSASQSSGAITISRDNTLKKNADWINYYISDLATPNYPQTSYVNSATPYYPAYAPNMYKYEVCVFQKDPEDSTYKNMACQFKDVDAPNQWSDGDQRCMEECFSLKAGANQHESTWDFLVWHIRIPTKDQDGEFETGKLVWTFQIPASDASNTVVGAFTCSSSTNYFTDGYFGLSSSDASDYPLSTTAFGSRANSYDGTVTLSVSSYTGSLQYDSTYDADTGAVQNDYWGVFPVKTKTVSSQVTALECTITFTWTDSTGYSRTILSLGHSSVAGSTNNGPMYIWETSNIRDYYQWDKFRMNWAMSDWEFDNGAQQQIIAQQRMKYGMGADSWCLILLPSEFEYVDGTSEVTASSAGGNLTFLNLWEFDDKQFLLTYHDEDVWPEWTNNIEVTNFEAPYGEQTDVVLANDGFKLYMACGGEGDEGEAAKTWNSLMITAYKKGYESGTWKETSVTERTIRDFSATFTLDDSHALGVGCSIEIQWENGNFLPSWIEVDGTACTKPLTSASSATCTLAKDITSSLVITFRDTLVVVDVAEDAEDNQETAYFLKVAHAYGTWDSSKKVYHCRNLNTVSDDCGSVDSSDFLVTIKGQSTRYLTVDEISVFPNNMSPSGTDWVYSDARIIFYVKNTLIYSGKQATSSQQPRVEITIPSDYEINENFDDDDHCYLNFTGTCSVSSKVITIYPSETIKSNTNYMIWLVQAVQTPTKSEAVETAAWLGETYFQATLVDEQLTASTSVNNSMYATLYDAAVAGDNTMTSLRVFPSNRGEYAQYTFKLQWNDASSTGLSIEAGRSIWIQFSSSYFDYFIGDAMEWFEGYVDEVDWAPVYYIPCLLSTDSGYMAGVTCVAKRNWLQVSVTEDIADKTTFEIVVVGIRNPDTTESLTYNILVMEAWSDEWENYQCKADQYYSCSYQFKDEPAPIIDFLNATIDYTDTSNALGESDEYEFWFTIFNEGTTVKTVTLKANTGKFILTFPVDYSFHPTLSATDDPNLKTFSAGLYQTVNMADYDPNTPYKTIANGAQANYTLDQWGNTLEWTSTEEIIFPSNKDETTFYDYVFTLKAIQNPSQAHWRMDESYDNAYPDDTEQDLSDNLWTSYEEYSKKFELAVRDEEGTSNSDSIYYNSRSYGILHHAYVGFFEINPILSFLDADYMQVMELEATAGLLSDYYYVATGVSKSDAQNHPLSFESVKVSTTSDVVQFESDEEGNLMQTLYEHDYKLAFKLAANQEEGGTLKFINWDTLEQTGYEYDEDKYAEMADTLVFVYEADEETYAWAELAVDELEIIDSIASLPIKVYLSQSPSADVTITLTAVFDEDENLGVDSSNLNDDSVVTIEPAELSLVTWDEEGNFTITVNDWDFTKGNSFRVYIGYSGTNAASYTDSNMNSIKLNVLSSDNAVTPEVTLDETTLETSTYGFAVTATFNTYGYASWLVLPEGQVAPATGEELASWSDANYERRQLQDDNSTEEEEEEELVEEFEAGEATDVEVNDWESAIIDDKADHLQTGWLLADDLIIYTADSTFDYSWDNEEDGSFFWANLEYVLYTTLENTAGTYSEVAMLSFKTEELPEPEWASATISGSSSPDDSQTYDASCSFAKAINWNCDQILYSPDWVFESERRARSLAGTSYEVCTQLVADPSGTSTQTPSAILSAAETCSNCNYYFEQYFKATASGSSYTAVGYSTSSSNIDKLSSLADTIPIADYETSDPTSNSITITFTGYEDHYLYSVLLKDAAQETLDTITSDQIISGLDYENQDALDSKALTWPKGQFTSESDEITSMDLTYENLKSGTDYAICVVAANSYTSSTDPLTNDPVCYKISTTGKTPDDDEDCFECSCDPAYCEGDDDSGLQLLVSVFLALFALLFA